jgi:hypothetical protein
MVGDRGIVCKDVSCDSKMLSFEQSPPHLSTQRVYDSETSLLDAYAPETKAQVYQEARKRMLIVGDSLYCQKNTASKT